MSLSLAARPPSGRRAVVAFSGRADVAWLRILKPGFRHVLVVIEDEGGWLLFNPMATGTEACVLAPAPGAEITRWLEGEGFTVVATRTQNFSTKPFSLLRGWRPHTCVEAVVRLLGVDDRGVFTPWQLYKKLRKSPESGENKIGKKALTLPPR